MSHSLAKRCVAFTVMVGMMLPSLPSALGAAAPIAPPRIPDFAPVLGDTQAIGPHYAKQWETLSDLARQAQGQGSLVKSGTPEAFLREPVDVAKLTADVLHAGQDLSAIGADLEQQFARDEQYIREKRLPEVLLERLDKARLEYLKRRDEVDGEMQRLAYAQKIANYDAQKDALGALAQTIAAMPSAKSFIPMKKEALARGSRIAPVRAPVSTAAELRTALEGPRAAQKSLAKAAPAAPGPNDLGPTDDAQITLKIQEQAAALGNNPVAIFNWVRNNIDYIPTYGSIQGSEMTRINKRGNDMDTASLLVAMLRAANIPARYVYGTVQVPIAQMQNWLGGNIAPNQVVELMTKGGIPAASIVSGGQVSAVKFEHVWVEAYVDFTPSRGAVNRTPDTWVPMDPSFKAYDVHPPIDLTRGAAFDAQGLMSSLDQSALHGSNGSVTGFDLTRLGTALDAYRPAAVAYADQIAPAARALDVRGFASIVPSDLPILPGTLPYAVIAHADPAPKLAPELEHKLTISYFASESDYSFDSPSLTYTIPTAKIGLSTIGVEYLPATQADADLLAQVRRDNAASLAPYLISVVPQIQIEGAVANPTPLSAVTMGTVQYWTATISDPQGIYPVTTTGNRIVAGSHTAYVVDAAGITPAMVQKRLDLIPDGVSYPLREGLQQAGYHYWMMSDAMDQNWASQFGGKIVTLPSVGAFSSPLQVTFAFGVARSGFFGGFQTDIKRNLYAAVNDTPAHQVQMFTAIGTTGSMLEASVWEMLYGKPLGSGASAARIIALANESKVPVYLVTAANWTAIQPLLQISADAKQEIGNAIAAGKRVVVPEREVKLGQWSGIGYVIQDPQTGEGVYQIDGGLSGGQLPNCIIFGVFDLCLFKKLLANHLQQFLNQPLTPQQPAALLAPAGTMFNAATALSAQYMWWTAFELAAMDFQEALASGRAAANSTKSAKEEGSGGATSDDVDAKSKCSSGKCGDQTTTKNPVDIGTGEKILNEVDYTGAGDDALVFRRSYHSFAFNFGQRMGQNWRNTFERSIYVPPPETGVDSQGAPLGSGYSITDDTGARAAAQLPPVPAAPAAVLALRGDGSYFQFVLRSGAYVANADIPEALTRQVDASGHTTGWVYFDSNDETEQYDASGRLLSITNRQGMITTLSYNADGTLAQVRNQFGRTLAFTYNADGNVDTITDPASGIWRYGYDGFGNLTSVTGPDSLARTYHYEQAPERGLLTGITDERGIRYATYKYDFKNRVYDETHANGAEHNVLSYTADDVTTVTDALGTARTYQFAEIFGNPKMTQVDEPCVSGCSNPRASALTYDANGFVASARDFNGNSTIYSRNARGLETARTEASGTSIARTVTTTYDPQWRVATQVVEPTSAGSRTTKFTLDARGNALRKDVTVGAETRTSTFTYNALGQRTSVDGPRTDVADVTTMTYTPNGDLETVTDAAGNVTTFANYDANGRAQTVTDPNGTVTNLTYDPRGRLKTSSTAGETTTYDYDGVGNLQKLTLPDGSFLTYTYDAAQRLTAITDSLGNSVTYTLDGLGNRTKEDTKDPAGQLARTLSRVFDGLARLKDLYGAQSQHSQFAHDQQGNLKTSSDPLSHLTANDYDALNRLTKVTQPLLDGQGAAGTIGYAYDAQDNLTAVTDPLGHVTSYGYSGFNELKTLTSPDTGVTTYTYDAAGNVKTMQDARGQVATYSYDALNRLKTLLYSDESISYTYDDAATSANSKGRLSKVADGSGSTAYAYDAHGRITAKTQVTGSTPLTVRYGYNAAGQLASITTPGGNVIDYGYLNNQAVSVTVNGTPLLTNAKYFPFGGVASWTWGNGQAYQRVYDQDGRIQSVTIAGKVRAYRFDAASRITSLTDTSGATSTPTTIAYDNLDRLTSAQGNVPGGFDLGYGYDLIGNRTSETMMLVSTTTTGPQIRTYSYEPTSNRLSGLTNPSAAYAYDAVGNTTADAAATYSYSGRNRLVAVKQGSTTIATYEYNALGQRVAKTTSSTTFFAYDEAGHLLGEYDGTGAVNQETVWLNDTPVATLRRSGTSTAIHYVWADHLDTPRAITTSDAASTLEWSWDSDPFGAITPQEIALAYNLRFPGQYFDSETGKHYNYYRNFDPAIGRYAESDPIGLFGGANTFSYVGSDPLSWRDRTGLIYRCIQPLHRLPSGYANGHGPLHHAFVCDDKGENCYGQDFDSTPWWATAFFAPGRPSEGDIFNPKSCERIAPDDSCMNSCEIERSKEKDRPLYSVAPSLGAPFMIAPNCQEFADQEITICILKCAKEKAKK